MPQSSHTVKLMNSGHLQSVEFIRYPRYVLFKGKKKYTNTVKSLNNGQQGSRNLYAIQR